jgi:ABC-type transport system involved in multi-copper enzyme maturation permease subunit
MHLGPFEITVSSFLVLALAGSLLLILFVLLRRFWYWLLGPVFFLETVRLARKGRTVGLRCLYAFVLLLVILSLQPAGHDLAHTQLEQFANRISGALLTAQCLVVLLLAPIYFGAAISEEKEKRSFDFLLLSPLPNHQIILGKLAARWLHLFGVLLAGLPILALTQLWGGVDLVLMLAGMVVMGLTLLSVGSFALLVSILCRRTWTAVTISYAAASLPFWCCGLTGISYLFSPIGFLAHLEAMPDGPTLESTADALLGFGAIHGLIALACVGWSMFLLRPSPGRSAAIPRVEIRPGQPKTLLSLLEHDLPADKVAQDGVSERRASVETLLLPLPIGQPARVVLPRMSDRPLLWKELNLGQSAEWLVMTDLWWLYFTVLVVFISMARLVTLGAGDEESQLVSTLAGATFALIGISSVYLVIAAGLRAAGSVSREREQRTLESLCSVPASRLEILQVKWFGSLWRFRRTLVGLAMLFALAGFCGARIASLALLLGSVAAHAIFAVSLGIFVSVISRTTLRAYLSWALVMIAILAGSLLLGEFVNERTQYVLGIPSDRLRLLLHQSLNPPAAWLHLMSNALRDRNEPVLPLFGDLFGIQVYLLAALVLCLLANRRFGREGERD